MKKLFISILRRIQEINIRPASEWEVIKSTPASISWHIKHYVLPISTTISIATLLGYFLALNFYNYTYIYIVIKALSAFCVSVFTLYVTFQLVRELCPRIGINVSNENLFKVLTYSFSAFWAMQFLAGLLANYKSLGSFLIFLGFYGIFTFWTGCDIVLELASDKKNKLLAISVSIAIVVYLLIDWPFGFALRAAHLAGMMN
jgi:hypothetical protein